MNTSTKSCYQRVSCKAKKRKYNFKNCSKVFLCYIYIKKIFKSYNSSKSS